MLIGVAIVTPSGASAGIGFAVPVNTVKRIVPQLIEYGKEIRPGLGVRLLDDTIARQNGIDGVVIVRVTPGGPAAKAGLRGLRQGWFGQVLLGDVIVGIDGTPVGDTDELGETLEKYKVGETVTVTILRDNRKMSVKVKLEVAD